MAETLRQEAQRLLADVPEEHVFKCVNGHILRNMRELEGELQTMSGDSYALHVNTEKNDFTNWVRDVIKDEGLARSLQKSPNQARAARAVGSRVFLLSRRLA